MADAVIDLLKAHFRQLRLPTMSQEFEKLARDAAATNQNYFQFLLRLTELELGTRAANAIATRIKNAGFPVLKDFDTFDFSCLAAALQAEGLGAGAMRMDRTEVQLLSCWESGNWEDSHRHRVGPSRLPAGSAGVFLHGRGAGQPTRKGSEAVHAG